MVRGYASLASPNGITTNATRTPKPFAFLKTSLFGLAIEYDYWKSTKGKIIPNDAPSYLRNISET